MNNTGLNKFDWITAAIGIATAIMGIVSVVTGTKANTIRMNEQAQQLKRMQPPKN